MITTTTTIPCLPEGISADTRYKSVTRFTESPEGAIQTTEINPVAEPSAHRNKRLFRTLHYSVTASRKGITFYGYIPFSDFTRGSEAADLLSAEGEQIGDWLTTADFALALKQVREDAE